MKSKIFNFINRATPFLSVVVLVLCCLSFPASAAENGVIKWEDLPHSSVVNGSDVTYTLDLMNTGSYYLVLTDPYYEWALGDNPSKVISEGGTYQFDYSTTSFLFDPLFFTDSQSSFYFDWRFQGDPGAIGFHSSSLIVRFFDSSGKRIGFQEFEATENGNSGGSAWRVSVDPVIPSGATSLNITIKFTFSIEALGLTSVSFPLDYFNYSFTVSADSVQNKQIQDKLNNLLDGTPEQNESANNAAGILGDKGQQLGSLADAIQPDKPNLDSVNTNVGYLVPNSGLNTLTSAISPIANNDLVIKLLVMVATLILVSYVLFGKKG